MEFDITGIFTQLWDNYGRAVLEMGQRIIIAVLIFAAGKIVITLSKQLIQKAVSARHYIDETFASVLSMGIRYGVIIVCLIMILDVFGANTTGLIALLGAAGVAIGFALKDTLGNIASGIMLLLLRPFKKGDYIECSSTAGVVDEVGLFATILETPDGIYISAPNSSLWGVPLKNYSHNTERRLDITVTISYLDSIDTAFQVLSDIIKEEGRFLNDPPPRVMVQSLGESGIGVTLRAWVSGSDYWLVNWDTMKKMKERIQSAGLTFALPGRKIYFDKNNRENKKELHELHIEEQMLEKEQ